MNPKARDLDYTQSSAPKARSSDFNGTEVVTMADEDTVVMTPEEKENVLKDSNEENQQEEDEDED